MPTQNLISASITKEQVAAVEQGIDAAKSNLPFLITLAPVEKKNFVKAANSYSPFIDLANLVVTEHPEILAGTFNIAEFKNDYQLSVDLAPVLGKIEELAVAVEDTMFAAKSDAMMESLQVYAAVQANVDKVPGLDVLNAKMAAFFKKSKRIPPASSSGQAPQK